MVVAHINNGTADLNDLTKYGLYYTGDISTTQHAPESGYFAITVNTLEGAACVQTAYRLNKPEIVYTRHLVNNNWTSWYKFTGTVVS